LLLKALDKPISLINVVWPHKPFWIRSINDLLDYLGIKHQSLYDTFGDKHRLFLEALKRYEQRYNVTIDILEGPGSGKEVIERVFRTAVQTLGQTKRPRDCLVVNTMVELAPHDEEVAQWIAERVARIQQAFYRALRQAYEQGELQTQQDLLALSRFLTAALHGLNMTAKAISDPAQL
jgi:TetR/AcrR family transcriptional regulator, transcriptional repressor for nem operon